MRDDKRESPSQTAGPYVHIGCIPNDAGIDAYGGDLASSMGAITGNAITLSGCIFDGSGAPVADAMIEVWQADENGHFPEANSAFTGFCRRACGANGDWQVKTVKPGFVARQAPHVTLWIVARGINLGLHTRIYFEGDDHSGDPVLSIVPEARRASLIARKTGPSTFHLDIHLQGENETVFFDV